MARIAILVGIVLALVAVGLYGIGMGWFVPHEGPGTVTPRRFSAERVQARTQHGSRAALALGIPEPKQILFGDLHVHTTFSPDAFFFSLPLLSGEGAHPPADACDFARFCSALDFWSINDHAEGITPAHWRETVESIRSCNAVAGDGPDPDLVSFLGWEWTQVGVTPEDHYGHKNVVLRHTEDGRIPTRPISARGSGRLASLASSTLAGRVGLGLVLRERRALELARLGAELAAVQACADDVPVRDLPDDCLESAATPEALFAKLDDWGHDAIVIPHGTTWGLYTPPGSSWDKQLSAAQHDPDRQTLVEVYSGHGNSEEYRDFRAVTFDADGQVQCPPVRPDYLPGCQRAGQIVRERCAAAGESEAECERRAAEARRYYAEAGVAGHLAVPGVEASEWLDAGQCRDCFLPSFRYRPGGSVQYMMALTDFAEPGAPRRFRFGFLAASDNHTARPGTGYKEYDRREMTEATGPADAASSVLAPPDRDPAPRAEPVDLDAYSPLQLAETERLASYLSTGGLTAVHAEGRSRDAIWEALQRREVYGTSGDRILLWFHLLGAPGGPDLPMGSEATVTRAPRFRVRAVGAFEQRPGCPDDAVEALGPDRLHHLCRDECYHPGDARKRIERIEVVRIRPQQRPGEPVAELIEDPWLSLACPPDPAGCEITFGDPEFPDRGRETLYYVRALQEPSPAVNGANLRCRPEGDDPCASVDPCYGDAARTPYQEDCLAPVRERAWSSPIFVAPGA